MVSNISLHNNSKIITAQKCITCSKILISKMDGTHYKPEIVIFVCKKSKENLNFSNICWWNFLTKRLILIRNLKWLIVMDNSLDSMWYEFLHVDFVDFVCFRLFSCIFVYLYPIIFTQVLLWMLKNLLNLCHIKLTYHTRNSFFL